LSARDPNRFSAVLDWEEAADGDPRFEPLLLGRKLCANEEQARTVWATPTAPAGARARALEELTRVGGRKDVSSWQRPLRGFIPGMGDILATEAASSAEIMVASTSHEAMEGPREPRVPRRRRPPRQDPRRATTPRKP
jgi:hypothetical protein